MYFAVCDAIFWKYKSPASAKITKVDELGFVRQSVAHIGEGKKKKMMRTQTGIKYLSVLRHVHTTVCSNAVSLPFFVSLNAKDALILTLDFGLPFFVTRQIILRKSVLSL